LDQREIGTVEVQSCPACGGTRFAPLPVPGRWVGPEVFAPIKGRLGLVRCRTCGLRLVNPRPDAAALERFYGRDDYECHQADGSASAGAKGRFLLDRIEAALPPGAPRTLLDYGAGGGAFLRLARARGWDVRGYEPGRQGLEVCRAAGLDVTDRLDALPAAHFGMVTLHHVFEHLEDHAAALDAVRRLLAPGGRLFIEVPNVGSLRARLSPQAMSRRFGFDERHRAFPVHLSYFNSKTLRRLLARLGWEVERQFTNGLGIEGLISRPDSPARVREPERAADAAPAAAAAPRDRPRRLGFLRSAVKAAILDTGLGENLCVFARPESRDGPRP
jgi:2-polyprenyl-3-methyl-5-hydroxy-6-metoxy-1,4-benzoquinol methylase